jgi:ABC-type antimicrobial peptide transport system permease subunit
MKYLRENTMIAIEELKNNRLRTSLTLLGVVIGVAAVIMVGSVAKSGRETIFRELKTFGLKSVWVYKSHVSSQLGKTAKRGTGINIDDVKAISREAVNVHSVSPVVQKWRWAAKRGSRLTRVNLFAVESFYDRINNDAVDEGRFLLPDDVKYGRAVCVIGEKVAANLFGEGSAVGNEIRVGGHKYMVVGVLLRKDRDFIMSIGSAAGRDANTRVIIPVSAYLRQYNTREVNYVQAEAREIFLAEQAAAEIKEILRRRHRRDYEYESQTMQQYIATTNNVLRVVSWIGGLAAAISLVVGGIGIMNIMTASVVERTREIGIRKALGARRSDISVQFVTESTVISLLGGIIGVAVGAGGVLVVQWVSHRPLMLAGEYVLFSLIVCCAVGVLAGIYPAVRASAMDPVEALRYE